MGNKSSKDKKGSTPAPKPSHDVWPGVPAKPSAGTNGPSINSNMKTHKLSESDYTYLVGQTGQSKDQIKQIFDAFMANNPDGRLDKQEFVALYSKLRPENPDQLDEISQFVFRAFDKDKNGYIDFNEFMVRIENADG